MEHPACGLTTIQTITEPLYLIRMVTTSKRYASYPNMGSPNHPRRFRIKGPPRESNTELPPRHCVRAGSVAGRAGRVSVCFSHHAASSNGLIPKRTALPECRVVNSSKTNWMKCSLSGSATVNGILAFTPSRLAALSFLTMAATTSVKACR